MKDCIKQKIKEIIIIIIIGDTGSWHHQRRGDQGKTLRKNISGEPESYSRQNYIAETLSKEWIPGLSPSS